MDSAKDGSANERATREGTVGAHIVMMLSARIGAWPSHDGHFGFPAAAFAAYCARKNRS
jgi:hypothetical protein